MAVRDRARSDLYLAQLRSQSVPNTPGGPLSPRDGGYRAPMDPLSAAEAGYGQPTKNFAEPKPFNLMPAPQKAKAAIPKGSFSTPESPVSPGLAPAEMVRPQVPAAQGENTYGAVAIPGSYAAPVNSPGFAPSHQQQQMGGFEFGVPRQ